MTQHNPSYSADELAAIAKVVNLYRQVVQALGDIDVTPGDITIGADLAQPLGEVGWDEDGEIAFLPYRREA